MFEDLENDSEDLVRIDSLNSSFPEVSQWFRVEFDPINSKSG
jgi:hypothetical protein